MFSECYTHFESILFFARAAAKQSVCLIIISDRFSEGIHAFQSQNKSRRPGTEKRPEYEEMKLSQAFCHETEEPEIEVRCRVYNINPDNSRELKQRSEVLDGGWL